MARRLDRILIVDLECTCWNGPPPEGQDKEIIEIGLCEYDPQIGLLTNSKRSILVRPEESKVSSFCTSLTSLIQADVEEGTTLAVALDILENDYKSRSRTWASYGDFDRLHMHRECTSKGFRYPFGPSHINIKNLYAVMGKKNKEIGMAAALEEMKINLEGTHHRGVDDAWNIGKIFLELMRWGGVERK